MRRSSYRAAAVSRGWWRSTSSGVYMRPVSRQIALTSSWPDGNRQSTMADRRSPTGQREVRLGRVWGVEYRALGHSGLRVSILAMGTMTFGGKGGFANVGSTD